MNGEVRPIDIQLSDVGTTSLVTLYCRALASKSQAAILEDPVAVELTRSLDPLLRSSTVPLLRKLADGNVHAMLKAYVAMRARHFDACARKFISRHPLGYLVNLGCGFDTRFHRIDNGSVRLYDVDRSDVISVKRQLLPETDRYRFVEASVGDVGWMECLPSAETPVLFLAEGLFMYLPIEDVRSLVCSMQTRWVRAELVAEVFNRRWLSPWFRWLVDLKLHRTLGFGQDARFRSGLGNSRQMEEWGKGIEFVDDWSPFDDPKPGLGAIRSLGRLDFIRKVQWVVHYKIQRASGA